MGKRRVQADPPAHWVADIGGAAACRNQAIGGTPEVGTNGIGRPVTREVDCIALIETAGAEQMLDV